MVGNPVALPPRYSGAELIASGGMADVYLAFDSVLERSVAVKVLSSRFSGDPEIRARFSREGRVAARLSADPNIVTIFDVIDVEGRPAIVMEFLPGGTLADRAALRRIPPSLALAWLGQAARALDFAHGEGVVHRDVKSANLMFAAGGDLRVTDFGIARIVGDATLTSVGTILGTSGYISPEQAVGGIATAASDRYGLAVVAFEILTGRRPYVADSFAAEAVAHATAPIPAATSLDPSLPASMDEVFARGLAKDPEERFRSCGELVVSLRTALHEAEPRTRLISGPARDADAVGPSARRRTRAAVLPIGLAATALVGVLAALALGQADDPVRLVTVLRTTTVAGVPRTVTVQTEPDPEAVPSRRSSVAAAPDAAALNDRGFSLLQSGDAEEALPLLELAVAALSGSGTLTEAYASYNLAAARFSTGSCEGVRELLERSKAIQGKRSEIKELERDSSKECKQH